MQRIVRLRPAIAPSLALAAIFGVLGLIVLSFVFQPPYEAGADSTQRLLGWARAGLFTSGAIAFVVGLALAVRASPERRPAAIAPRAMPQPPRSLPAVFTLVALGRTADDTRAIADAATPAEAVRLLREWSDTYPGEHIVIFDSDAEPVAFKRPTRIVRRSGRRAA